MLIIAIIRFIIRQIIRLSSNVNQVKKDANLITSWTWNNLQINRF